MQPNYPVKSQTLICVFLLPHGGDDPNFCLPAATNNTAPNRQSSISFCGVLWFQRIF